MDPRGSVHSQTTSDLADLVPSPPRDPLPAGGHGRGRPVVHPGRSGSGIPPFGSPHAQGGDGCYL